MGHTKKTPKIKLVWEPGEKVFTGRCHTNGKERATRMTYQTWTCKLPFMTLEIYQTSRIGRSQFVHLHSAGLAKTHPTVWICSWLPDIYRDADVPKRLIENKVNKFFREHLDG